MSTDKIELFLNIYFFKNKSKKKQYYLDLHRFTPLYNDDSTVTKNKVLKYSRKKNR